MILETYLSNIPKMRSQFPKAHFEIVTRAAVPPDHPGGHVLSPSWDVINSVKKGEITHEEAERRYTQEMRSPECQAAIEQLALRGLKEDVFLVCFEAPGDPCHRHWLKRLVTARQKELRLDNDDNAALCGAKPKRWMF